VADGVRFDIAIEANGIGVDATAESLTALAAKIDLTSKVATTFDRAVTAVRARLEEATAVTKAASAALATAEGRYKELETAANKAAKEVEKAAAAGKDTTTLAAAAASAAAKMKDQASAVDALRTKSDAAAAAQKKLEGTLKTLEGQQASAAAGIKAGIAKELAGTGDASGKLAAKTAADSSKVSGAVGGMSSAAKIGAAAWVTFAAAGIGAAGALAKFGFGIPGNIANVQRLQMANQRMQLGFQKLFTGLQWGKFTNGLEDVMSLFDQGTSSAKGMKVLVETILQPLIDAAAKAAPYVKEMFKGLIYGAMQVVIAVLKIRNEIFKAMSPETRAAVKALSDKIFTLENAFNVGAGVAILLAIAFGVLTVSLIAMAVAEIAALWPILLIVAAIALVIAAIVYWDEIVQWISDVWDDFVTGLSDLWTDMVDGAKNAASDLINGLVNGIKKGVGKVVDAVKGLASSAIKAFTGSDGIDAHSPSLKFQKFGGYMGEGTAIGVDESAPMVEESVKAMAETPSTGGASGGGSSSSSRSLQIGQITINAPSGDAESIASAVKQALLQLMEGVNLTTGGGEAPAS